MNLKQNIIVSAISALVVVLLVLFIVGHVHATRGTLFGQTASTLGTNVIPLTLTGGSVPTVFNALEASESFISDGLILASSTLAVTGNTNLFGTLTLNTSGTALTRLNVGTCNLALPATGLRIEATSTAILTCAATGVAVGDKVFMTPLNGLLNSTGTSTVATVGSPNYPIQFLGASSTAAGVISVALMNLTGAATSSFIQATSTWTYWAVR